MSSQIQPTYGEIITRSEQLAADNPGLISYETIGPSEEDRPIPVLRVGDSSRDLPLLAITGGMHGSEETGRATALALAEWFAGEGRPWADRMSVVIIPCGNPDGTVRDIRFNSKDVDLCRVFHYREEPEAAEALAIDRLLFDLLPDCFVDCHGLAGGGMCDYEFLYANLQANMSTQVGFLLAREMDAAANALGYPTSAPRLWGIYEGEGDTPCYKVGRETNALVMVMETTEYYYPLEDSIASGLARLKVLVKAGTRKHSNQPYPGFPCDSLSGGPAFTLMPYGATYRERRENRRAMMHAIHEDYCSFGRARADLNHTCALTLSLGPKTESFPQGVVMQAGLDPRATVTDVRLEWPDGTAETLAESPEHGYTFWEQDALPRIRVNIKHRPQIGENRVVIHYDAPYEPHVSLPPD